MTWQDRFDRLLKAMASGEPHKPGKKAEDSAKKTSGETKGR